MRWGGTLIPEGAGSVRRYNKAAGTWDYYEAEYILPENRISLGDREETKQLIRITDIQLALQLAEGVIQYLSPYGKTIRVMGHSSGVILGMTYSFLNQAFSPHAFKGPNANAEANVVPANAIGDGDTTVPVAAINITALTPDYWINPDTGVIEPGSFKGPFAPIRRAAVNLGNRLFRRTAPVEITISLIPYEGNLIFDPHQQRFQVHNADVTELRVYLTLENANGHGVRVYTGSVAYSPNNGTIIGPV